MGEAPKDVHLIVSTIAEAEFLLDYLFECKTSGRDVNVLYGIPPSSTAFSRLEELRKHLGPDSISVMLDHPSQLRYFVTDPKSPIEPVNVFIKVDTGYHRAGVPPDTQGFETLVQAVVQAQKAKSQPNVRLQGFYSHNSNSYSVGSPTEAMEYLEKELQGVQEAAAKASALGLEEQRLVLSVGATPSVTSAQNLLAKDTTDETAKHVKKLIGDMQQHHDVELHAGVYPLLDMQQLATHARPDSDAETPTMTTDNIGLRILGEVLSTYTTGTRYDEPEALIGAGTLALGREPCKSYDGWGVVAPTPWHSGETPQQVWSEGEKTGWVVGRISQEHGILSWKGDQEKLRELIVGEKVLLWPNHACIASAGYSWYLLVDSEVDGGTKVVDVWIRARGW